jgi:4-amino-4-deoxy-L-arabinose transferase-like glycosyltransferase
VTSTQPDVAWPDSDESRRLDGRALLARLAPHAPLAGLLALTAVLYLWGLSRLGYANDFYAAAVRSGTESWKAFFFGSFDASSYITVDKPPASLWLMELSGRLFGFSSFSMLLPQALEGVAAVALVYAAVRRWFSTRAALASGVVLAVTPVAALMFRYSNPDALLVLLLVAAAYAVTRALERASTLWLALAGAAIGFAFLTKMMQAFVVLPAFALVYLVAAPTGIGRRVWQLMAAGVALVVAGGWWVAIVELWPSASRPYIGGSTNNSILDLIWGYNGLGRIDGAPGRQAGVRPPAAEAGRASAARPGSSVSSTRRWARRSAGCCRRRSSCSSRASSGRRGGRAPTAPARPCSSGAAGSSGTASSTAR